MEGLMRPLESPDSLNFAPVSKVAPLVQSYIALPSEKLLEMYSQEHVVKLGQLLVARFFNECLQLQRGLSDLQSSLQSSEQRREELERGSLASQASLPMMPEITLPGRREAEEMRMECAHCLETSEKLRIAEERLQEMQERALQYSPKGDPLCQQPASGAQRARRITKKEMRMECAHCLETSEKLRIAEERLQEMQERALQYSPKAPQSARGYSGAVAAEAQAPQEALLKKKAAVMLQSAWRRRAAQLRFERHLLDLIFPQRPEGPSTPMATLSSLRLVQGLLRRVWRSLRRRGLDFELAYRCADAGYQKKAGTSAADGSSMRVGHFLHFLCQQQG
ncbi:unnamed protein product, partial [Durusdinium trenchii]